MCTRLLPSIVLLALTAAPLAAEDAASVLQAVSANIGAATLKTIEFSGTGWSGSTGQSFTPDDDWPRFDVTAYSRTIDYEARTSREELTRVQGGNPARGGGGTPIQGEQRQAFFVSDTVAWNLQGGNAVPAQAAAEQRQLDIWLTPHGFVKAALAAKPTVVSMLMPTAQGSRRVRMVTFTAMGKYRVNGLVTDDNVIELVQTWIANPVLGDMLYETRYTQYRDFGGIKFPTVLHSHQGDPRLNQGHNTLEVRVTDVKPNAAAPALTVPDAARQPAAPVTRVESQKVADGVWVVGGGSHHSIAVDFRDFVAVVEAPVSEARSLAVIAEINRLIPNKPIRYIVNTHHHFDHLGGLRTFVAHGATVVTHQRNHEFYERVVLSPAQRTLEPDLLSIRYPYFSQDRKPVYELVNQKYVISDGTRTLDVYPVTGLPHAGTMLVAYLPKERILVNADLYSPPPQGQPMPAPTPSMTALHQTIQRLKLDVAQHVPIHGRVGTMEEFSKIVAKTN
jgi:glyoxylase-like metal-dependent hydrolase (beta-lactamase superfamily II)